ncbi:hypothetical protein [Parasitella parasitica]|uniref:Uncharacterized protein n=1 Tax=Parasitella parasitica TaxID=35722 RepID=A0A0B7N3Y8_9FUNG|nr:hypothetical protein [Parasitella parasitica]
MSGKKRTKTKEPKKTGSDKRSRTDGVFNVGESTSSSPAEEVREVVSLPTSFVVAEGAASVVNSLEKIQSDNKEKNNYANPVIIGSRAAAFWFPSFRPCADWDIVATAQQAIDLIKNEKNNHNLEIKLVMQPLDANVVRRKPLPTDIKKKLQTIPEHLYKISGKNKDSNMMFEIEIAANEQDSTVLSSAGQILDLCNRGNDNDAPLMNFSVGPSKGLPCIVAPIELLETLKTSHIFWPAYFDKHIADLHGLRTLLASGSNHSTTVNYGIRADKTKPLTPPARTAELEQFLVTRTLEVEAFRGTPGAHINLNVSNEDFLGRDDDLFVTRHIPHDDVHTIVMYGEEPIYDQLKTDKSKAMVSRELFEKAPYEKQIQCVKEEAMVISLERFLLPKLTLDPASAYRSALIRICTTLTKGWFRQFAVDNFPRLAVCDKDLIPIRDTILTKHPLPPKVRNDPLEILKKTITNLEDLHTMERLMSLTKALKSGNKIVVIGGDSDDEDSDSDDSDDYGYGYRNENRSDTEKNFWTISSSKPDQPDLLVSFVNSSYANESDCIPSYYFHATLSVQPLTADVKVKQISAFKCKRDGLYTLARQKFHKAATSVSASNEGGSWGGGDIWSNYEFIANSLEDEVQMLGLEGLTEDLLMAYILAIVQPKLFSNGETPIQNHINAYKSKGVIPVSPNNHLWFNCWKYNNLI